MSSFLSDKESDRDTGYRSGHIKDFEPIQDGLLSHSIVSTTLIFVYSVLLIFFYRKYRRLLLKKEGKMPSTSSMRNISDGKVSTTDTKKKTGKLVIKTTIDTETDSFIRNKPEIEYSAYTYFLIILFAITLFLRVAFHVTDFFIRLADNEVAQARARL